MLSFCIAPNTATVHKRATIKGLLYFISILSIFYLLLSEGSRQIAHITLLLLLTMTSLLSALAKGKKARSALGNKSKA